MHGDETLPAELHQPSLPAQTLIPHVVQNQFKLKIQLEAAGALNTSQTPPCQGRGSALCPSRGQRGDAP